MKFHRYCHGGSDGRYVELALLLLLLLLLLCCCCCYINQPQCKVCWCLRFDDC
jgi:hypothetical protein